MLISSKELRKFLESRIHSNPIGDFTSGENSAYMDILRQITAWEARQANENPDLPFAFGSDAEKALLIYCTPKLYEFVDALDDNGDNLGLIEIGKIWKEVRKFLKEGRFKRK